MNKKQIKNKLIFLNDKKIIDRKVNKEKPKGRKKRTKKLRKN